MNKHFYKQTVRDVPLEGQLVLMRADYNVPLDDDGKIHDDLRIKASLDTIRYLTDRGCRVVIISHLGRPEGRDPKFSLEQIAERLAELLDKPVKFIDDVHGDKVSQSVRRLTGGSVALLENLRYYQQEEQNDYQFAANIAKSTGARYFVQDGFGVVHRAHASTSAIAQFVPAVAGLLLEREYMTITEALRSPERPLVALLGGAKVSDKIAVIERFVSVADKILIGGAMANTFLVHRGYQAGSSKVESGQAEVIERIYNAARAKVGADKVDEFIVLPQDVAVAKEISQEAQRVVKPLDQVGPDDIILDIGDQTIERFSQELKAAKTVIWNGTLGLAEYEQFSHGSARAAMALATTNMTSIIGGGDTADFATNWDGDGGASFSHVSTGGGASLELMSGEKLPGIETLMDAPSKLSYTNPKKA